MIPTADLDRWAFQLKNGRLAYDDADKTQPKMFSTRRAAKAWDEASWLVKDGARLVKVEVKIYVVKVC